jgi:adenylate kinase
MCGGTTNFDKTVTEQLLIRIERRTKKIRTVILVTGSPGVGKTSVSHTLASKLDARYIGITELVKNEKLVTSIDKERKTLVADTKKLQERLKEILSASEGTIIIEGHYAVDVVPETDVHAVFVLRRDPNELKTVLEKRGYPEKKVWENLASEILDVCLWDALSACEADKVCEIDVSGKTVEAVAEEIVLVLEKKKECRSGIVDWLGKLEKTGQLEEFLRNF